MDSLSNIRKEDNRMEATGVLGKAANLLDALCENGEMTSAELAQRVSEPRSSVYRLLGALQAIGLVEPGYARGGYRLGLKLFRLGSAAVAHSDVRDASLDVMQRVYD